VCNTAPLSLELRSPLRLPWAPRRRRVRRPDPGAAESLRGHPAWPRDAQSLRRSALQRYLLAGSPQRRGSRLLQRRRNLPRALHARYPGTLGLAFGIHRKGARCPYRRCRDCAYEAWESRPRKRGTPVSLCARRWHAVLPVRTTCYAMAFLAEPWEQDTIDTLRTAGFNKIRCACCPSPWDMICSRCLPKRMWMDRTISRASIALISSTSSASRILAISASRRI
jgi:hypothetical protein